MAIRSLISPLILPGVTNISAREGGLRDLILNGNVLSSSLSFSRASAASIVRSTDGVLVEVGNNVPRFDPEYGLLIEGQRTNGVRNPRWAGAVPGVPGTAPTNMSINSDGGVAVNLTGVGTEAGASYIDLQFVGTASPTAFPWIFLEGPTGGPAVTVGQTVAISGSYRLVSGTWPAGVTLRFEGGERNAGGTPLGPIAAITVPTPTSNTQRASGTGVTAQPTVATVRPYFALRVPSGTAIDVTLRFSLPQAGAAPFASSPILPPIGTPGVTTRLADGLTAPLSSLGISPSAACTIVGTFMMPQVGLGSAQNLIQIDGNADTNRYLIRNDLGGGNVNVYRVLAGVDGSAGTALTAAPGTPFRVAFSIDGTGRYAASANGGAVISGLGGPTSGLLTLRVGSNASTTENLNGYVRRLAYLPYPVSDAALRDL